MGARVGMPHSNPRGIEPKRQDVDHGVIRSTENAHHAKTIEILSRRHRTRMKINQLLGVQNEHY